MKFVKRLLMAVGFVGIFYPVLQVYMPLSEFTDLTGSFYYLIGTAVLAVLLPYWFVWIPIQIGFMITCYRYYFPSNLTGIRWLGSEFSQINASLEQFINGGSSVFPTNVSFILIVVLIALSAYLLIVWSRPTVGILVALIYLMILQVFTKYDYFMMVVQILGIGLVLYGLSNISLKVGWKRALVSFVVVLGYGYGLTWLAVKATEQLVPQQQWMEQRAKNVNRRLDEAGLFDFVDYYNSGGQLKRMGYGEDDSVLGGPVQQNFDPVFSAYDDAPHYWRISTRTVYTGVGWEFPETLTAFPAGPSFIKPEEDDETVDVVIEREDNFTYFPYTYGLVDATFAEMNFELIQPTEQLRNTDAEGGGGSYTLTLIDQEIDFAGLNTVGIESPIGLEEYLDVPEGVPQRVWDLAAELTAGDGTMYEKVRALEQYLRSDGGFRYSLRETSAVPDGFDYVDHFLFESRIGYCDNFSTAMVILARMSGIPARWAKGFNSGTATIGDDGETYYAVTNANAHSWPEIFFPGEGWIPFEPTPAFRQPLTDTEQVDETSDGDFDEALVPVESATSESDMVENESSVPSESQEIADVADDGNEVSGRNWSRIVGALVAFAVGILFVWRRKWYPLIATWLLGVPFIDSHRTILWLFAQVLPFERSQTLRQYFEEIADMVPMHRKTIVRYVTANEESLYAPVDERVIDASIYTDMITVYRDIQISQEKSSF
ncbi:transglutaminase-like domain-containing protein [Jeotgalibaca porci]|uniref:transglutaminase-like domain-containing protein n=1 Tax=Jeotgalibaca porci TaxID=1868793 RepID=UPI0035A0F130